MTTMPYGKTCALHNNDSLSLLVQAATVCLTVSLHITEAMSVEASFVNTKALFRASWNPIPDARDTPEARQK